MSNDNTFVSCAEPRGGSQDDFELALKGYYDSIHLHTTTTLGRKRRVKNVGFSHLHAVSCPKISMKGGAALLGVCRGKVYCISTYIILCNLYFSFEI